MLRPAGQGQGRILTAKAEAEAEGGLDGRCGGRSYQVEIKGGLP
ncbi:hypothetical protein XM38_045870 [Halomicronema hongdechloris C2206]|uniref:Uncharacterized protein n=1 Tax=Halomicronema hongdechloris C2206 TaxID=1641165 RepID=A0A1Z3HTM8_9CYAN|nr:hypothetical protein XM38_045870 [Halomicronema hongdechloris C2206]